MNMLIAIAIGGLLLACESQSELSDEARVQLALSELEQAAEERSLSGMLKHISDTYKDYEGNDHKQIQRLLQLQLIKNQSINIFSKIREMEVIGNSATVEVSAAMASRGVDLSEQANRLRVDTYRFSVLMKRQDKRWKIHSVSWQRGW